jgi:hypothetical protein
MDKPLEQAVAALELIVQQLVALHGELIDLLHRKRQALREGRSGAIGELCALENEKIQAISELEKRRLELVARITLLIDDQAAQPMRMGELAERLPEPVRGRLLILRQQLRDRLLDVQQRAAVARRATESLMKHLHGVVQTIGALSTGVSTYSSRGARPPRAIAVSTFSMTA